jgi:UDP-2-acetamido-3-amino-2,3-dideoxy-glucuronate N-acetyltransferase
LKLKNNGAFVQLESIHPTAFVEEDVIIGKNVRIWHHCQVRKGAVLNDGVSVGKSSFIDEKVIIGKGTRIQNGVNLYNGVEVGNFCFIGPAVVFTNDYFPRVGNKSWTKIPTKLENGCSIGAGAVIRCGITIGAFSMIGAGAVVTKNLFPFSLAMGVPAELKAKICACASTVLDLNTSPDQYIQGCCKEMMSEETYNLAQSEIEVIKKSINHKITVLD